MQKQLVVLSWNILDNAEFQNVIAKFEKNGYTIHIFDNPIPSDFRMNILPDLLAAIEAKADDKIVVLSNIIEVIFSWFRCYNGLVTDFVYFNEGIYHPFIKNWSDWDFFSLLFNFASIEGESIQGKIYVNLDLSNYKLLFPLMIHENRFRYFDLLDNYPMEAESFRKKVNKTYYYNERIFEFNSGRCADSNDTIYIEEGFEEPTLNIGQDLVEALDKNKYFIIFLIKELYQNESILKFITSYFYHLRQSDWKERQLICSQLLEYINRNSLEFREKVGLLSLLAAMKSEDDSVLKILMSTLKEDNDFIDLHYSIFINGLSFVSHGDLLSYDRYELDKGEVLKKIAVAFDLERLDSKGTVRNRISKIAVKTDYLLGLLHSPTKVALDYALGLKRLAPDVEVRIFNEDNMISCPQEEMRLPFHYTSTISAGLKKDHLEYLKGIDIPIYYSDPSQSKRRRTREIIDEINLFQPDVILTCSAISIADLYLYRLYPVVFFSMGGLNFSTPADVYLYCDSEEAKEFNLKFPTLDAKHFYTFNWGLNLPEPVSKISRADYKIGENDFVLVTVGNRLDGELTEAFADQICSFLSDKKNVKWLIIGKAALVFLNEKFQDLLGKQIIRREFESDLSALYRICNVYVNPPRHSGGYSIALAMNMGLPVAIFSQPSDGLMYVGKENSSGNTMQEYIKDLERLYSEPEYWEEKSRKMKQRIGQFSMEKSVKELLGYFEIAKKEFAKRTNHV